MAGRGTFELKSEDDRELALQGLTLLHQAMSLSHPPKGIDIDGKCKDLHDCYANLWKLVGAMLLGDDLPEYEEFN